MMFNGKKRILFNFGVLIISNVKLSLLKNLKPLLSVDIIIFATFDKCL